MWTHYIAAQCTFETAKVRTYDLLRKSVLRSFRMRKARLDVSRNRAKQEQIKSASGGLRGVRHVAGGWGKAPQPPARSVGSFLGVKAKPLRGRCASLDPHPLRQRPSKPLRGLWRVFQAEGGSRGWCGPQPRRGGHGPDATGATKPAGRVSGALFPGTPAPRRRPRQGSPEGAYKACGAGGTPCLGFKGRAAPLGQRSEKTLCRRRAFPALRASLLALQAAPKGA